MRGAFSYHASLALLTMALQMLRQVRFQVNGEERTGVTPGSPQARQVLRALNITELRPPTRPAGTPATV